jgi:hypothetical protein
MCHGTAPLLLDKLDKLLILKRIILGSQYQPPLAHLESKSLVRIWPVPGRVLVFESIEDVSHRSANFIKLANILKVRILLKFGWRHLVGSGQAKRTLMPNRFLSLLFCPNKRSGDSFGTPANS